MPPRSRDQNVNIPVSPSPLHTPAEADPESSPEPDVAKSSDPMMSSTFLSWKAAWKQRSPLHSMRGRKGTATTQKEWTLKRRMLAWGDRAQNRAGGPGGNTLSFPPMSPDISSRSHPAPHYARPAEDVRRSHPQPIREETTPERSSPDRRDSDCSFGNKLKAMAMEALRKAHGKKHSASSTPVGPEENNLDTEEVSSISGKSTRKKKKKGKKGKKKGKKKTAGLDDSADSKKRKGKKPGLKKSKSVPLHKKPGLKKSKSVGSPTTKGKPTLKRSKTVGNKKKKGRKS